MRRSKSSSNIPLPKFKRTLSSESLKNSQPTVKRTNSSSQLDQYKSFESRPSTSTNPRPSPATSIKPNSAISLRPSTATSTRLSSATNNRNSNIPSSASKYGFINKGTLSTPKHNMDSRFASPGSLTTQKMKIGDKKFTDEQFKKISSFLEERVEGFDPKSLKALTINNFVIVIQVLFKEIDPRINMNMGNYKETVFKYLKLYKYPGPVSISMLKTVNTKQYWSAVISMFGWLVDLINDMNGESSKNDKVRTYILSTFMHRLKNLPTKGQFIHILEEAVGFNQNELDVLEMECEKLKAQKDEKEQLTAEIKEKERKAFEELQHMKEVIKDYKEGALETKIKNELKQLKDDLELKELENDGLKTAILENRAILSVQKYSLQDKENLMKQIEDMQYTLKLKKEDLDKTRQIKDDYDYEETNLRREIETEIHAINNRLLKLKLGFVDVDAKKIQLPDRGFLRNNFLQVIEEKKQYLQNIKETVEAKVIEAQKTLAESRSKWEQASLEEINMKKEVAHLESVNKSKLQEIERITFESKALEEQLNKEIAALREAMPNLKVLRKKKIERHDELLALEDKLEQHSERYIEIFQKKYENKIANMSAISKIMTNILNKYTPTLDQGIVERNAILNILDNYS